MYVFSQAALSVVLQFVWDLYKGFIADRFDTQNNYNGSFLLNETPKFVR